MSGLLVTSLIITGNLNKIFSPNEIIKKQRHETWSLVCDGCCFMERRFLFTDNKVCSRENICFNLTEQKFGSNKIFENEIKSEVSSLNFELLGLWLKGIKGIIESLCLFNQQ